MAVTQGGLKNSYDSIEAFSGTDLHEDLEKFDVPTLVMHGENDQIVPIDISGKRSAKLIKGAKEIFTQACRTSSPPRKRIKATRTCWNS